MKPMTQLIQPGAGVVKGLANDAIKFAQQRPMLAATTDVAFGAAYDAVRQAVEEEVDPENPYKNIYKEVIPMAAFMGLPMALNISPMFNAAKKAAGAATAGEAKINAGAIYPYDVTKSLQRGNSDVAIEQWKALPNYMEGSEDRILPVVDTSGSMGSPAGGNPNVSCMDVSVSLGLYISERNTGAFKDAFVTFSAEPKLQILKGNLRDRFAQLQRAEWG